MVLCAVNKPRCMNATTMAMSKPLTPKAAERIWVVQKDFGIDVTYMYMYLNRCRVFRQAECASVFICLFLTSVQWNTKYLLQLLACWRSRDKNFAACNVGQDFAISKIQPITSSHIGCIDQHTPMRHIPTNAFGKHVYDRDIMWKSMPFATDNLVHFLFQPNI